MIENNGIGAMLENNIPVVLTGNTETSTSFFGGIFSKFSGFGNFLSGIDFTPFKRLLILVAFFIPIYIIYLFWSGKLSFYGFNFGESYGLKLITGSMGASKTRNTFQSAYFWKKQNPNGILISNMPYDFVDIFFNSKIDFDYILRDIIQYIRETNGIEDLRRGIILPPIRIIVDEAHYYLFARDFKAFTKNSLLVLTQCRKRNIQVDFITQELGQIDVFIRRLCPYIVLYEKGSGGDPLFFKQSLYYVPDPESTSMKQIANIQEPEAFSYMLGSKIVSFFRKKEIEGYFSQRYLTNFVIGSTHEYANDDDINNYDKGETSHNYDNLIGLIQEKSHNLYSEYQKILEKKNKKNIFSKINGSGGNINEDIIQKQKEMIDNLLKLIPDDKLSDITKNLEDSKTN